MHMILHRSYLESRLARILALGLFLFASTLLVACSDNGATETPQPTASPTSASASPTATPSEPAPAVETPTPSGPVLQAVTTSNITADWAEVVGGDRVEVFSLLPPGSDPHAFAPGPRDVSKVADADVVLTIGLGLEAAWLDELLHNAKAENSAIVALGDGVDPLEFSEIDTHDDHMDEGGDEHEGMPTGRLLIGDGEEGSISVIDLESGDVDQNRFDVGSRAGRIYSTASGRYAIAVSSDADAAHLFDGGIYMEAHGDHFDLVEDDVRELPVDLSGDRPVHLYVGDEWSTIYYDGSGDVALINEHELEEQGDSYVPTWMNAGPQHGAALPLEGDLFAVSLQHPDYAQNPEEYGLPIGAEIRDLDSNVLYTAEGCDSLHGDASNGHMAAFGCAGGVLVLEAHDGEYSHTFIAPDGVADDFRLTSVWGYPGLDTFFALGSSAGLYVVDPEEEEMELLIPATEDLRPIQVHIGPGGESLLVVMSDGELRAYDTHDGELQASNDDLLTTPVETGFWARPHLATAPGAIFITDSVGGEVLQLDEHDLEVVGHWDVGGVPTKIAFVGIVGEPEGHDDHDEEDGHAEEGDDHGHGHGALDPHFWFDPNRVKIAVNEIAAQYSALDPDGAAYYAQNAADYAAQLDELHAWTLEQVKVVPQERRLLVTSHDTFAYFADVYGFEVIGALIPSLAPDVEPSAEHLADVVRAVREHNAPAVFSETTVSGKLPEAVARESGAGFFRLYADSLGEGGSGADTYLGMVRANVEVMVEALQ